MSRLRYSRSRDDLRLRHKRAFGETMAYEAYILVIFGLAIFFQQFIMYLMFVRIKQLLRDLDGIEGKIKINDTELENLMQRVDEFKRVSYGDEWQKSS